MGETMRRYWLPALLTWELPEPDCPPVRVKLLGEELVAFRDSAGAHRAPGRALPAPAGVALPRAQRGLRAPLRLPRVEIRRRRPLRGHDERAGGAALRPQDPHRGVSYGGGGRHHLGLPRPRGSPAAPPHFAWTQAPATHRHASKVIQETNWLQGLEGGIDTSHVPILHRVLTTDSSRPGFKPGIRSCAGKAPTLELDVTDYGYRYAGLRPSRAERPTSAPIISSCPFIRSAPRVRARAVAASPVRPATSGCPWMTRPPWSTTGSTARPTR